MPLLYVCCAWLAGLYLGSLWSAPGTGLWVMASLLLGALWFSRRDEAARLGIVCGLALLLGMVRIDMAFPGADTHALFHYNDRRVCLVGTVVEPPDVRDTRTFLTVSAETVLVESENLPVEGKVLVHTSRYPQWSFGDRLQLEGRLETPPSSGRFSYQDYLAREGILSLMMYPRVTLLAGGGSFFASVVYTWRDRAKTTIERILPDPEAALLSGILIGTKKAVPQELMDKFNATGTSHIIVISGFNIVVLAAILSRVANQWLSRYQAVVFAMSGVAFYTFLVGADAAVVRAAIMGGLTLLAVVFGRQGNAVTALAVAALIMTFLNPFVLWDLSFQLSAGATLGLMIFALPFYRRVQQVFGGPKLSGALVPLLKDALVATLAAQVFTLPLILYHFGRLSLTMPLANLLVLPVQPAVMATGGVATLLGLLWLPAGTVAGWCAWLFLTYTIHVVETLSSFPFSSVDIGAVPAGLVWSYYGAMALVLWARKRRAQWDVWQVARRYLSTKVTLGALSLVAVLLWASVLSLPDGYLHVRFLNVGQGDAILIVTPDGQQVLIDGGPSPAALLSAVGRAMPFWDREIELVMLSHPDQDHLLGLVPLLERYRVRQVIDSAVEDGNPVAARWRQLLAEKRVPVHRATSGMSVDLGSGIRLEVLSPGPDRDVVTGDNNDASTVARLTYGETSFLFTGDLGREGERRLLNSDAALRSTVLKVSHHGTKEATTDPFLKAVDPQLAVISVGENRFGHPSRETLERLAHIPTLRTDKLGTVDIVSNGEYCWVGHWN